ncbi:bifunctional 3-(3-hydroxy-phenyl)propionate/3-hydroxycinnamic acid hydroxylase [Amycolatopsis sp. OK19-0408]|uniref:Bifunctional 3-(3-hydroxy-phenyl)propionate/3-hydroxycinnamic acid hydroxylase n=1 Tax=Amycolatopsis iheyensis TaxID=2945988 RepID=A0A9X2NHD4_9PSEU|nr:bifunctional 3-(3-hydroxy-phenyl)propionate/3-hydroxycinnamic acid hydroxylase [Amycolatopsis iheyensis]MCR6488774.1 bifunctional 3-(3-hydroxy-phenyl)propionate/3-hydroxycinnamic acid hydroxylase [Amycolatopsis iheyensis]
MASLTSRADVLVVGCGPSGAVLASLLARRGHRVLVLERHREVFGLPRATSFDGETARLLAAAGVGAGLARISVPATGYQWRGAAGDVLLDIAFGDTGRYGWPDANTMHQPALEELLGAAVAARPTVEVRRGLTVVGLEQGDNEVTAIAEDETGATHTFRAGWLVGCDGANSVVAELAAVPVTDLGFSFEWLLCDVELQEPREFVPTNLQLCDPARPTTLVGSGRDRRRWEFMCLPGESAAELDTTETAWRLLAPHGVTPENAKLLRSGVYRSHARWAQQWRQGRVLVAGDAAHLMPPFAGQGMCSGIRDVSNLAWKLDLVLGGRVAERLLDTYTLERRGHTKAAVLASVKLGRVICVTDPAAAADRDAAIVANGGGRRTGPPAATPLTTGLLQPGGGDVLGAGRLDDLIATGFVLITTEKPEAIGESERATLAGLGGTIVHIGPDAADRGYADDLRERGAASMLVRPDYHVYGTAAAGGANALLAGFFERLGAHRPSG